MSSYTRLNTDVDDTEEAELRRLEGGAGTAAGTCRRQHHGAAHETEVCPVGGAAAAGGAATAHSGLEVSSSAHAAGHAARPLLDAAKGK
eukprot:3234905-Prymnesium_polylepis.1